MDLFTRSITDCVFPHVALIIGEICEAKSNEVLTASSVTGLEIRSMRNMLPGVGVFGNTPAMR